MRTEMGIRMKTRTIIYPFSIFLLFLLFPSNLFAGTFTLMQGEVKILPAGKITKIISGNKKVISVKEVSGKDKKISVTAKGPGESTLFMIGPGQKTAHRFIVLSKKIDETYRMLLARISKIPGANVVCSRNKIFLSGTVYSLSDFNKIKKISDGKSSVINEIKISPDAVKIEAQEIMKLLSKIGYRDSVLKYVEPSNKILISIDVREKKDIDTLKKILSPFDPITILKWAIKPAKEKVVSLEVKFVEFKEGHDITAGFKWGNAINILPAAGDITAMLEAHSRSGKARIIASPRLVCTDGKKADFLAGGQIPIRISTRKYSHVEWKNYGISLKFSPVIIENDTIDLNITIRVSDLDYANSVDNVPAITERKVETRINIKNGKTFFISGLVKNSSGKNVEKIPLLGSIPILGELFKSRNFLDDRSDLIVLITPVIGDTYLPDLDLKIKKFDSHLKGSIHD